jgi:outer membrane protein assembly factor BamB
MNGSASSPVVEDGTIYIGGFGSDYQSSIHSVQKDNSETGIRGSIYALEASTGELKWEFGTHKAVWSSPSYENGKIYAGDLSGTVYSIDASSGEKLWEFKSPNPVFSSPTSSGSNIYYGTRDMDAHQLSEDGEFFLYSLSAEDGTVDWKKEMDQGVFGSPAVVNGTIYVGDQNGTVHAIESSTGGTEWSFEVRGNEDSGDPAQRFGLVLSPTVDDGVVYVPSYNGILYGLDASDGEEIWNASVNGIVASSPAVTDDSVYIGNYHGEFYSIDKQTGEIRWKSTVNKVSKSSPAVTENTVVFGDEDGVMYGLSRETGEVAWSYSTSTPILSSPAVADGRVYFSDMDAVYAIGEQKDGTSLPRGVSNSGKTGGMKLWSWDGSESFPFNFCNQMEYRHTRWVWNDTCRLIAY